MSRKSFCMDDSVDDDVLTDGDFNWNNVLILMLTTGVRMQGFQSQ